MRVTITALENGSFFSKKITAVKNRIVTIENWDLPKTTLKLLDLTNGGLWRIIHKKLELGVTFGLDRDKIGNEGK